jgi:hypothetical protein
MMYPNRYSSNEAALADCLWCRAPLGQDATPKNPKMKAQTFCSRRCEIEANFWLFQELCAIEITHPPTPPEDPR